MGTCIGGRETSIAFKMNSTMFVDYIDYKYFITLIAYD